MIRLICTPIQDRKQSRLLKKDGRKSPPQIMSLLSELVQWVLVSYPNYISPNATELSGEIKMAHPNKNVTIVHGARLPVSDHFPEYFREKAVKSLEEHGVNIILNEKIDIESAGKNGVVKLSSGKTLPADLVVPPTFVKSALTLF